MRRLLAFTLGLGLLAEPCFAQQVTLSTLLNAPPASPVPAAAATFYAQAKTNGCKVGPAQWKRKINNLFNVIKGAGITNLDALWLMAAPDQCTAEINLIAPTLYALTPSGTCVFIAYSSLATDAATCSWATTTNLSSFVFFTQNAAHVGTWFAFRPSSGTAYGMGYSVTSNTVLTEANGNGALSRVNTSTTITDASTPGLKYQASDRTSASLVNTYANGIALQTGAASTSAAVGAHPIALMRDAAVFAAAGTAVCEVDVGGNLTAAQETALYSALAGIC